MCADNLKFGPLSILFKVKNWKSPDFQKDFVTQSLESFTLLVSGKFTKKDFTLTYQMTIIHTCCFVTLRHLLKVYMLWKGWKCIFILPTLNVFLSVLCVCLCFCLCVVKPWSCRVIVIPDRENRLVVLKTLTSLFNSNK